MSKDSWKTKLTRYEIRYSIDIKLLNGFENPSLCLRISSVYPWGRICSYVQWIYCTYFSQFFGCFSFSRLVGRSLVRVALPYVTIRTFSVGKARNFPTNKMMKKQNKTTRTESNKRNRKNMCFVFLARDSIFRSDATWNLFE